MHRPVTGLSLISLVIGALIVGTAPIFVRYADVGPAATAFWRLAGAGIAIFLVLLITGRRAAPSPGLRGSLVPIVAGAFFFALDMWVWNASIHMIPVARATLFACLAPIYVALYTVLVLKQKMRPMVAAGCLLALTGAAFLAGPAAFGHGEGAMTGNMLAIIGGIGYAGYVIGVASARTRLGTLEVMYATSLIAALCVVPPMLIEGTILPHTTAGWVSAIGLALFCHAIGQGLIAYALANLPVLVCSLGLLLQPVSAAILGWIIFGEIMSDIELFGATLVISALVLVNLPSRKSVSPA
ncbi:DMT family transporter [Govanella unica]|uniref:DMT family transporter n=1 Tax=Govanella unica TaxID=2975056 RepID=A0A9X3TY86_9PROT|nr:DMT family transporter [Govania unica]MDA5194150.1 DMT family transporter [Govania unica]